MNRAPAGLRALGSSGLLVSPVSVGTSFLGNPPQDDGTPSPAAEELAVALLHGPHAMIDTSNNYAGGRSEAVLGRTVARHGLAPGRWIATKVDAESGTGRFDRDRVWRSFEESTARLGVDRLPLLHLHDPHAVTPAEALGPGGAVQGLLELREQGLAGAIGVATDDIGQLATYLDSGCFDALLTHNRYTMVDRSAESLIEAAAGRRVGVLNAAPFGGGLLAGRGTRYGYRDSPPELLDWVRRAGEVCAAHATGLVAVALHFSLRCPSVHSTVVGVNRPNGAAELEQLRATPVPDAVWPALDALGTPPSPLDRRTG